MTKIDKGDIHDLYTLINGIATRAQYYQDYHDSKEDNKIFLAYASYIVNNCKRLKEYIKTHSN